MRSGNNKQRKERKQGEEKGRTGQKLRRGGRDERK